MIQRTKAWRTLAAVAILGTTLLVGGNVVSVGAQGGDPHVAPPGDDATLRDTPAVDAAAPKLVPGSKDALDGDLGEHQVTGTVSALDKEAGTLTIDVKGKTMQILFPPTALAKVERGDEVTVAVALHKVTGNSRAR